jgi:hypothetical protein
LRIEEQETCLTFHEHDDDDDDINYFTLTTPFYPLLPALLRHFRAVINVLAKVNLQTAEILLNSNYSFYRL